MLHFGGFVGFCKNVKIFTPFQNPQHLVSTLPKGNFSFTDHEMQ